MGQLDAAVGKRATYARGLEKTTAGLAQGSLVFLKYLSTDSRRDAKWNKSLAITSSEGEDKGTPGPIDITGGPKYDLTAWQLAIDLASMVGAPTINVLVATKSWLLQFYPNRNNAFRGIWDYLFRGSATVGATTTLGRRTSKCVLTIDEGKRVQVVPTMTDGLGDSISGLSVAKTGNAGTYAGKISSRGRRPKDTPWTTGLSLYLKVTAKTGTTVTFKGGYAAASPGDGSGWPTVTYDTITFTVTIQSNANNTDGYSTVQKDAGPVGMFGEDYQPFQIAASGADYSLFAVNDEFEIPAIGQEIAFVNLVETRLSAHGMDLTLGGTRKALFTKGSIEIDRPYKPYKSNRSRYSTAIDASGNVGLSVKLDERFFDNYYRDLQDANSRFQVYAQMQDDNVLLGTTVDHEGVEIYAPSCAVEGLVEGAVAGPDVLMHQPHLNAEQPATAVPGPGANFPGSRAWQVNITTGIDPSTFF